MPLCFCRFSKKDGRVNIILLTYDNCSIISRRYTVGKGDEVKMSYTIETLHKGYLLFTITRNEKRNAINYAVMDGLSKAIKRAAESDIKALIITGEGERAFCSGGDLSVFHSLHTSEEVYPMLSKMANILYALLTLPIPTIALINGAAVGGGCELAAACDFRLARKNIQAGFVQGKQAITTGWGGASILAEKLLPANAMKLLMEADLQTAEQLKEAGFFNELFEGNPLESCDEFIEKMIKIDVDVLHAYKRVWIRKWEESNLRKRIEEEIQACSLLWESEQHQNYVQGFLSKQQ